MSDLFVINKDKDKSNEKNEVYYTIIGKHSSKDDQDFPITNKIEDAFAKKRSIANSTKYFIKIGAYGRPYDPMGMYSENQVNKFLSKTGKSLFEFKEVNQKVFNFYITFLKTKNKAWLSNTERELQ